MRYISTRGQQDDQPLCFCEILLRGLAPDGGLYLPLSYPQVDRETLGEWVEIFRRENYAGLAAAVMQLFIDDIPAEDLCKLTERAYSVEKFGTPQVAPVTPLQNGIWLLHLSNGPTAAFKDMAMQMLGELFQYVLTRRGEELNILGATSGDTGSSAEYAMLGKQGVRVFMLTPRGRMTPFQQAQMYGLDDPNIINVAVDGVFDDCQDLVKAVSADADFKARYSIGAVNSINWARLLAQVVYYVAAWCQVSGDPDQSVSFSVPTGNFGDICAGHVARQMGVPIDQLIVATNENNVLEEFFQTGIYRIRPASETLATSSPSMDISKASNFERFIFDLLGRDQARIRQLFGRQLSESGAFDLSHTPEFKQVNQVFGFQAGASSHRDRIASIRHVYQTDRYLLDPHTADGWHVARNKQQPHSNLTKNLVVLETALPVKFGQTIREALDFDPPISPRFAHILHAKRRVLELPNDPQAVKDLISQTVEA